MKQWLSARFVVWIALLLMVGGSRWTPDGGATAMTIVVTNTNDSGTGSLRQAIIDANNNPGDDVIDATGVTGTIHLLTELPDITDGVTIKGPGAKLRRETQTAE